MLDEKDLQAIGQMMDVKLAQQKQEIKTEFRKEIIQDMKVLLDTEVQTKFNLELAGIKSDMQQMKADILRESSQSMKVLLETEVTTKFNLLAEGQDEILRRMPNEDDMDIIDGRLDTLEAMVKRHSREIAALKQAN